MIIRPETAADRPAIAELNRLAFGQEAEARLVDELREGGFVRLSLVAAVGRETGVEPGEQIVGHILFSRLPIVRENGVVEGLALAPMAVTPARQRQGIGSRLAQAGLSACRSAGHAIVVVLGHAEFYPRFGFSAKLAESLSSPFGGGPSWMALELTPGALNGVAGRVEYAPPFSEF